MNNSPATNNHASSPDPTGLGKFHLSCLGWSLVGSILLLMIQFLRGQEFDLHRLTTSIIWALACLASGMAVGFLFGVPRVIQPKADRAHPESVGEDGYGQRVNMNLEEISDWLTKIIVGLGLVELRNIPIYLNSMAELLAKCLGSECSVALASAIIVWFMILGFFIGYLPTRIYLAFVFNIADRLSRKAPEQVAVQKAIDQFEESLLGKAESWSAVADGLAIVRSDAEPEDVESAIRKLKSVLQNNPTDARAAVVLARLQRWKKGNLHEAVAILTHTAFAMREKNISSLGLATVLYNKACYNVLLGDKLPADQRNAHLGQTKVQDDLEAAVAIEPHLARDARKDDDLKSLRSEGWFEAMLKKYDPKGAGKAAAKAKELPAKAPKTKPPVAKAAGSTKRARATRKTPTGKSGRKR